MTLIGLICGYVVIHWLLFPDSLTLRNALIQGILVGFGLAFVTIEIFARIKAIRVNGWVTVFGASLPGNSMLTRAAYTRLFPGPINVPKEAIYWRTNVDGSGHTLSGEHNYIMHFPPGGLPPVDAFWSLTMVDFGSGAKERFVANPLNRYIVGDRSGLVPNPDGSVDIYIQNTAPAGHESNWLPAPKGQFRLWLRAYMPSKAILNRKYVVPPIMEVKSK
jgi:hypothetical protein